MSYFLGRILKGRMFWLSLFIMLVIVIVQYISMCVTTKGFNDAGIIKVSPYLSNILHFNRLPFYSEFYLLIFPMISAMAVAGIYRIDKNYGFIYPVISKMGTRHYFRLLYFINFIVSFFYYKCPFTISFLFICDDLSDSCSASDIKLYGCYCFTNSSISYGLL